ncbi:MAG: RNA polymerase factor sigma-32, partial [Alphaproteobacteria bacterium]|nr:RNA polymerase factor sigma-32 [Alphaproteobacteria bacterium]
MKDKSAISNQQSAIPAQRAGLPVISDDSNLERYIQSVQKFPILSAEQEYEFARAFKQNHDKFAAEQLISSHLRL